MSFTVIVFLQCSVDKRINASAECQYPVIQSLKRFVESYCHVDAHNDWKANTSNQCSQLIDVQNSSSFLYK